MLFCVCGLSACIECLCVYVRDEFLCVYVRHECLCVYVRHECLCVYVIDVQKELSVCVFVCVYGLFLLSVCMCESTPKEHFPLCISSSLCLSSSTFYSMLQTLLRIALQAHTLFECSMCESE